LSAKGLVFAAPASGSGKTMLVAALLRHLKLQNHPVASAKIGPDYIDPAFHAAASGRPCLNIDLWAMRPSTVAAILGQLEREADLLLVEGVMGLFDAAADGSGSTADFAAATGLPVILVVDARGQGASAAALVRGFASHRAGVEIEGVIFNRVGGAAHGEILRRAMVPLGIPVLGLVPRSRAFARPERHLGLVQALEHGDLEEFLDRAAAEFAQAVDVGAALRLAMQPRFEAAAAAAGGIPPLGQRISVARDAAFAFLYPTQLEAWKAAGAEIAFFSPLADEAPRDDADAVYLPGGYPELHGGRLAGNQRFLDGLRQAASRGATLFGECGGYMVLGRGLVDAENRRHAMAGLLPLESSFAESKLHLGYRDVRALGDGPVGAKGARYRGHEFHYATILAEGEGEALFEARDSRGIALGPIGRRSGSVCGSFIHLIDLVDEGRIAAPAYAERASSA
jgi:cobyrinic acid a,c-diamide synthase